MNINLWIKNYRKRRKIQRVKPHFWHLNDANLGYVQNYKVGTRSIRQALSLHLLQNLPENSGKEISYKEITDEVEERFDKQYSGFYMPETIRAKWADMSIFTFVRNPLSRLYSCYANKVLDATEDGGKFPFAAFGMTPNTTFDEFVRIVADTPDSHSERHFRSQTWFITANGKLITDFIGKIENFNQDWEELRGKHDLPVSPHNNQSSMGKTDFSAFYTKETYRLVVDRFQHDIEALGYENDV